MGIIYLTDIQPHKTESTHMMTTTFSEFLCSLYNIMAKLQIDPKDVFVKTNYSSGWSLKC